jgi:hypothetical protein
MRQMPRSPYVYLALASVALMLVISGGAWLVLLVRLFVYLLFVYVLPVAVAVGLVYLAVRALATRTGWGRRRLAPLLPHRQVDRPEVGRYERSPANPAWEPPATPPATWPATPTPATPTPASVRIEVRHVFEAPNVTAVAGLPSPLTAPAHPETCPCSGLGVVACPRCGNKPAANCPHCEGRALVACPWGQRSEGVS